MLTVTGNLVVFNEPEKKILSNGNIFFNFIGVAKHPRKNKTPENPEAARVYYKVSLLVKKDKFEEASTFLIPGKLFWLRFGELDSTRMENGIIFTEIRTNWNSITMINGMPS